MRATIRIDMLPGTEAAIGRAGGCALVVGRPEERAGGMQLGFNGAELLGLAIGGCFANDVRYVAHTESVAPGRIAIHVVLDLAGDPLLAVGASLGVACETRDGSDPAALVGRVRAKSMAMNSVTRGLPATLRASGAVPA